MQARVVLTNFGTFGDLQPYLALGVELLNHGHRPIIAFFSDYEQHARQMGLDFFALGPSMQTLQARVNAAWMRNPDMDNYPADEMSEVLKPLVDWLPQSFERLSQVTIGADVLVSGPGQPASRMVHEITGIPFVSIQLTHFGGSGPPALAQTGAALINPFRRSKGLKDLDDPLMAGANSPQLALYAMSKHVNPSPSNWPAHQHMTGYFFLDDETWSPDSEVLEFLESGHPPVVVTFGSCPISYEAESAQDNKIIDALAKAGCRGIIQNGGLSDKTRLLTDSILQVGYVPHSWLLPRAALIVHHGGAGTTAAAFRSGNPAIVVPHMVDQFYWARIAFDAGCAPAPIPFLELTSDRLAEAIKRVLRDESVKVSSGELGPKIRDEHGVRTARVLIEKLLEKEGHVPERGSSERSSLSPQSTAGEFAERRRRLLEQRTRRESAPTD